MATIIYSNLDPAGRNIAGKLRALHDFAEAGKINGFPAWKTREGITLMEINSPAITADYLDGVIETDLFVFASRHKSASGKPTLTAHACGNWNDKAEFGGKPRTLAPTNAYALRAAMKSIANSSASQPGLSDFEVVLECTHHGPLLETPFIFVEVGSSEKEWGLPEPAEAVAEACLAACTAKAERLEIAIGIGGIHYPKEFTKAVLGEGKGIATGHICPKYALEWLDGAMLSQMLEKSGGKVRLALIDWKSLKQPEREKALSLLNAFNVSAEKA